MTSSDTGTLIIVLLILIGIFVAIRRFWLWYWNLSAIHQQLREQSTQLRELQQSVKETNTLLSYYGSQLLAPDDAPDQPPV